MDSIHLPPPHAAKAKFRPDFGQRFLLTIDTEEEFEWREPFRAEGHSLTHVPRLRKFQQFCENLGVCPVYLVDYPVATSSLAADILREPLAKGTAEVGIQLHPWVNPPFDEDINEDNSFAGNLPPELERAKFFKLKDAIENNLGVPPSIYRAGRYGVGPNTPTILRDASIAIDSSVRSKFDYSYEGGNNYRNHPLEPYWVDENHSLLELPLTTVFWGMLRKQGDSLYPRLWRVPALRGLLARTGMLERIPLTPEGVTFEEAIRGIDIAIDDGLPILVFSFHSPSLRPGNTPYIKTEEELDDFYDWWRRILTYLEMRNIRPTTVGEIIGAVET
jgi:hypothetical protein